MRGRITIRHDDKIFIGLSEKEIKDMPEYALRDELNRVYAELVKVNDDNAALRARVGEQQTQAKIDVLNKLLQEIDETVYVETWGYIEQKRDKLSAALAKGAK